MTLSERGVRGDWLNWEMVRGVADAVWGQVAETSRGGVVGWLAEIGP